MDPEHPHYAKTKELVIRAAKMSKKALLAEIRAIRKDLFNPALSKLGRVALVNEFVNMHLMKEVDRPHVSAVDVEEVPKEAKPVKKSVAKRAEMTSAELHAHHEAKAKREPKPHLKRIGELRRAGHSLAEAWKILKGEKAAPAPAESAPTRAAPKGHHKSEVEASKPKSHKKEAAVAARAAVAVNKRLNPLRAQIAELMKAGYSLAEAAAKVKEHSR